MTKQFLRFVVLTLVFVAFGAIDIASAQNPVTFRVRMSIKMREGTFQPGSGDIVRVAAAFSDWGNSTDTLRDIGAVDSVYEKVISLPTGFITNGYKFLKTLRGGIDWESNFPNPSNNREYTVPAGGAVLPIEWFDRDSIFTAASNVPVTFRVNMSIKIRETGFQPGAGDIVRIAGSFNDWQNSRDTLKDLTPIDSIYEKTVTMLEHTSINFKFLKTLRAGLDWESNFPTTTNNRVYVVPVGGGTYQGGFFDRDSIFTPPVAVSVTFRVNMRVKILETTFQPGAGDIVRVAGSFNDWGNSRDTLIDVAPLDSIYQKTVTMLEGAALDYKFLKTPRGGLDWEGDPPGGPGNRRGTVPVGGTTLPAVWFNNDSVVNAPVSANVRWQVDMNAFLTLGWFQPANRDTMEVRGGFNGWGGTRTALQRDPLTASTYFAVLPFIGSSGDQLQYKFFNDLDSAGATARFPGYLHSGGGNTRDDFAYEHPYTRGDGNQVFTVNTGGDISPGPWNKQGIHPKGLLLNNTDSVTVTLKVNMGPAKRAAVPPFNPATDTVKVFLQDRLWVSQQQARQGAASFPIVRTAIRQVPANDSLYQVTFTFVGRTHYGLLYGWRYTKPGTGDVSEGAGLGAQGGYRVRFVQPLAANSFPRNYVAPQDAWVGPAPLPGETPPFSPFTDVKPDLTAGIPQTYTLDQNYPNPFNPTTTIKYSIPGAARVTLKVYNLLGQEVATLVNENQPAGKYIALFERNTLATGVYFYKLEAGKFSETKKMLLLK